MTVYLLDATPLSAFFAGRPQAIELVNQLWSNGDSIRTSIIVYGEVVEYFTGLDLSSTRLKRLKAEIGLFEPIDVTRSIMDNYASLRRAMRRPYGSGLIGDIDTLIAATAIDHNCKVVTTDSDFGRVPELSVMLLHRRTFEPLEETA